MKIIDFKKEFSELYNPKLVGPRLVSLPAMNYIAVEGVGSPSSEAFQQAIAAMYGTVFTIKFSRKKAGIGPDYRLGPLECEWWSRSGAMPPKKPEDWQWRLMMWQPKIITAQDLDQAISQLKVRKPNPALNSIRFVSMPETNVAQIVHIGPYDNEADSINTLHRFIEEQGLRIIGRHCEIYMNDPRRTKPEKLRTIIRYAVVK